MRLSKLAILLSVFLLGGVAFADCQTTEIDDNFYSVRDHRMVQANGWEQINLKCYCEEGDRLVAGGCKAGGYWSTTNSSWEHEDDKFGWGCLFYHARYNGAGSIDTRVLCEK